MASDEPKQTVRQINSTGTPRSMRPRATPNAEINAQEADKVRRDMGLGYPLEPNQAYRHGGKIKGGGGHTVHNYCAGGKVISSKSM